MVTLHHNKIAPLLPGQLDREVELINMMGSYINRNRIPIQINGVYVFVCLFVYLRIHKRYKFQQSFRYAFT